MWGPRAINVGTKGEEKDLKKNAEGRFPAFTGTRLGWAWQEARAAMACTSQ